MRIRSALLALALALTSSPAALAAGEHAVGFTAGGTAGTGFTYRLFGKEGLGLQATGMMASSTGTTFGSFGAQMLLSFRQVGWGRLYGVAGIGFYRGMSPIFGMGPGIEIGGDQGALLAIELPVAALSGGVLPLPNVSYLFRF